MVSGRGAGTPAKKSSPPPPRAPRAGTAAAAAATGHAAAPPAAPPPPGANAAADVDRSHKSPSAGALAPVAGSRSAAAMRT
jgi:hypothetical protein